jgi:hypothetical protein
MKPRNRLSSGVILASKVDLVRRRISTGWKPFAARYENKPGQAQNPPFERLV